MAHALFLPDGSPDWPRLLPVFVAAASVAALGFAYTAQYAYDLHPCILCLYQRIPYALTGVFALAALMMPRGLRRYALVFLCVPVFLAGSGLAFYHVGVEQHWWASAAGCGGAIPDALSAGDFRASLLEKPEKSCADMDWTLFGVSMATYNVFASLVLSVITMAGLRRMR